MSLRLSYAIHRQQFSVLLYLWEILWLSFKKPYKDKTAQSISYGFQGNALYVSIIDLSKLMEKSLVLSMLGWWQSYQCFRGPNYFEVDVDVTSSRAANSITGMVQGATSNMIIDLGIVLEVRTFSIEDSVMGQQSGPEKKAYCIYGIVFFWSRIYSSTCI